MESYCQTDVGLKRNSNQDFVVDNPQETYHQFFSKPGYNDYGMTGSVRDYFLDQSYGKLDIEFDVVGPVKLNKTMAYYGAPTDNSNDVRPAEMISVTLPGELMGHAPVTFHLQDTATR